MLDGAGVYDTMKALLEECISHDISTKLLHRWVPTKIWFDACNKIAPQSPLRPNFGESGFKETHFNSCLSRHHAYRQTLESFHLINNSTGIYKIKIGKKYFLYINPQKGIPPPQQPVIDKKFWATVKETEKQFVRSLRRFDVDLTDPPDAQRRRLAVEAPQAEEEEDEVVMVEANNNNQGEDDEDQFSHEPFWSSNEARKLFGALPTDQDASVTLIRRKIATLKVINHQKKDGYKLIIDGGDALDECTAADISQLKERSLILLLSYKTCLKRMGSNASFASCIKEVLEIFEETGINQATHWETVRIWNRSFRC